MGRKKGRFIHIFTICTTIYTDFKHIFNVLSISHKFWLRKRCKKADSEGKKKATIVYANMWRLCWQFKKTVISFQVHSLLPLIQQCRVSFGHKECNGSCPLSLNSKIPRNNANAERIMAEVNVTLGGAEKIERSIQKKTTQIFNAHIAHTFTRTQSITKSE